MSLLNPVDPPPIGPVVQPRGFVPGTAKFVLGSPADVVDVPSSMLPTGIEAKLAIGGSASVTHRGVVVAVESGFTAGTPANGDAAEIYRGVILNAVPIRKDDTGRHLGGPDGETVIGLLQAANGSSDGDAVVDPPSENLQLSFVYRPNATPSTFTAYTLPAGTYYVNLPVHILGSDLDYGALFADDDQGLEKVPYLHDDGNPNGVVEGFLGQSYHDDTNGIWYRCTGDGSTVWVVV